MDAAATGDRFRRHARVWRHEEGRLVPLAVEIGVSGSQWTELLRGPAQPGDELVTTAAVR